MKHYKEKLRLQLKKNNNKIKKNILANSKIRYVIILRLNQLVTNSLILMTYYRDILKDLSSVFSNFPNVGKLYSAIDVKFSVSYAI